MQHGTFADPFPLLALPDLVLQHVLTFLSLLERKAVRGTCRKLCKVASAAVRHFHVEKAPGDTYLEYLGLHEKFPNVQVISLSNELVSDRPFAALVTLTLCKLKNLSSIVLLNSSMALSAAGMATLCQCKHIKQLVMAPPFVSKGPLAAASTQAILTILGQLPGLTHLLLLPSRQAEAAAAGTGPGMGGPAALQQQATGLHGNGRPREWQLNEAALWCLGCLHGLVQLEFGCDPSGLTDLACLAALSNLRRLALRRLSLEAGERLSVLAGLPALRSLALVDGAIGEDSLLHVGRCTKLTRLELQGCHRLREAGLTHLLHLHQLCYASATAFPPQSQAWLGCYRLREAGLTHLLHLHQLACFRCSMPLTESGLSTLVTVAGSRLTLLEADSIEIAVAEAHAAVTGAAAAAAGGHIHGMGVNATAAAAVMPPAAGAAAALTPERTASAGFGQLGPQFPGLRALVLRRLLSSSPQLWQLAPRLTSLVVWGEANNAGLARAFTGQCALQRLVLSCGATSDVGLAAVSTLTKLRDLTLCEGSSISPQRLITVVQRLPQLQVLQLGHIQNLGDDGLARLVAAAQQLQVLGLQEPGRVSDQGFALLAGLPKLATLWVDCCRLSVAVLMALACNTSLCLLEVHRSHPEAEILGLQQLELLGRIKGPRLEVVVREGARSREELLRPLLAPGGVLQPYRVDGLGALGGSDDGSDGVREGEVAELSVGFGVQELVLEHGLLVGGNGPARGLMGQGTWQVGLVAAADGMQENDAWPDIEGLQL